mmetsp:Transcript_15426/g.39847  ORF Transcript_15426/g.39847 Transcript_15426/m.39847 type:complete len:236 (+) Transcript_15426:434-1141(+)
MLASTSPLGNSTTCASSICHSVGVAAFHVLPSSSEYHTTSRTYAPKWPMKSNRPVCGPCLSWMPAPGPMAPPQSVVFSKPGMAPHTVCGADHVAPLSADNICIVDGGDNCMYCSTIFPRRASYTGLPCAPFRAITLRGPHVTPPSTDDFWQMSRLEFLVVVVPAAPRPTGLHPSPVKLRHSAKAFSVRLSPASAIDGTRMHGYPSSPGVKTSVAFAYTGVGGAGGSLHVARMVDI